MDAPPEVQEEFMNKLEQEYADSLPDLLNIYPQLNPEKGKALQHFLGLSDAKLWLSTFITQGEYAAQKAVEQSQMDRNKGKLYKNTPVTEYLRIFAQHLQ